MTGSWPIGRVGLGAYYPIGLDLIVAFFPLMHKPPICDKPFTRILNTWLTPVTWTNFVDCKVLHFINNENLEALDYKTL